MCNINHVCINTNHVCININHVRPMYPHNCSAHNEQPFELGEQISTKAALTMSSHLSWVSRPRQKQRSQ